jgi:cyclic pyranopterin monophosphate synthase
MRDISNKINTLRTATAEAILKVSPSTIDLIKEGKLPKGDPLSVAKVAAIQSAKNTSQIIPYCHPLPVDFVSVEFDLLSDQIRITTTVKAIYKTGVEMEALTAASVAALTVYDMAKMVDEQMEIAGIKLLEKTGGKSDFQEKIARGLKAAVVVMSDTVAAGKKSDASGRLIVERLKQESVEVSDYQIVPDDAQRIAELLKSYADEKGMDLVITTGGTGLSARDVTPEALDGLFDREVPGVAEAMRSYGQARTPYSMLSRSRAGVRKNTLIVCLPGSSNGVKESLDALLPALFHAFKMMRGAGHTHKETVSR